MSRETQETGWRGTALPLLSLLLVLVLGLNLWIFRYFLVTGATSACIAVLLDPLYQRLSRVLKDRRSLAAAIVVVMVLLVVLAPLVTFGVILGRQAVDLFEFLRPHLEPQALAELWSRTLPERFGFLRTLQEYLGVVELAGTLERIAPVLSEIASGANRALQSAVTGVASAVIYALLFLLLLFFLLRDGRWFASEVYGLLPFSEAGRLEIFDRVARTVKGVLYSMVVVPVVQGLLAILGFWLIGLPRPVLWGVVVILAAIVPGIGSPAVWIPACVYLFFASSWWQGLALLLYGTLIIGTADNVIKPLLLHGTARIHTLFAFLSIVGGLLTFGPAGFLLGPVIFSLLLSMLSIHQNAAASPRQNPHEWA